MTTHVEFKNLGIDLLMNRRMVEFNALGGGIYYYALIICAGFLLAWLYVSREEKRRTSSDDLTNMILIGLPVGVISARIYYVIFSFENYKDNLWEIFEIWNGGLAVYGGVIGAALTVLVYTRVKKLSTLHYLDLSAMGFLIGQSVGRWGNFVNGEAHGVLCSDDFLLGMHVNGAGPFHPTFFYESALNALGFLIILLISRRVNYDGLRANLYIIWYGIVRFFVENLRTDSLYIPGTEIRVSAALSLVLALAGAVILFVTVKKRRKKQKLHLT